MANPVDLTGYHLTFDAEMSSAADMAKFRTTFINGDRTLYTNYEDEEYVDNDPTNPANPFSFGNGALSITARPVPAGGHSYTSGTIQTWDSFSQNQGYFEIRAQTPIKQGFWSAFWMIPNASYPEIDILEQPSNLGANSRYWHAISTPEDYSSGYDDMGVDLSAGYHSYGFLWTANTIQFSFDGNLIGYSHTTPASMANLKMFMIANLAVGTTYAWPGAPVAGATASYNIDYIRAYSLDPSVPAVAMQPISSPDGKDTRPNLGLPATVPTPVTIGSGADALVLQLAEDAWQGDARFTISIDGVQQGGIQTVTASHVAGQTQAFTVLGAFGTANHQVSVNFMNDAWGGTGMDRNLYVTGATINGAAVPGAVLNNYSGGPQSFGFTGNNAATNAAAPTPVVIGSGANSFVFSISEDAFAGDAQFTIAIDGVQQGGVQTAKASHAAGATQSFTVNGNFGTGGHTATINFLNDAYGGSGPGMDRNLYVDAMSFDGSTVAITPAGLYSNGSASFVKPGPADTLKVSLAEDAFQGDAMAQISIDGNVLGTVTVKALAASATPDVFTFTGNFGTGPHSVGVRFLNDAYGSGAGQDRNLYVKGVSFDGTAVPNATGALYSEGQLNFAVPAHA